MKCTLFWPVRTYELLSICHIFTAKYVNFIRTFISQLSEHFCYVFEQISLIALYVVFGEVYRSLNTGGKI